MYRVTALILLGTLLLGPGTAGAKDQPAPEYDATLAESLGADERGMRSYVLVVLKTGPERVTDGPQRAEMFKGHMANIRRLADDGVLVFAGPLDGVDGWRGLFIFATPDIATAKTYVDTDPVIITGEMIAEYHVLYGSAALMMVYDISRKITREAP